MSDFSDRPFVAGSLTGLRAFDVDALGRLRGVTYAQVFTPGENVSVCGGTDPDPNTGLTAIQRDLNRQLRALNMSMAARRPATTKVEHTVAGVDCSCGFYAYFDGSNEYGRPRRIAAVVEGYGVCTVGSRGFRAEKARLLALVVPRQPRGFRVGDRRVPYWTTAIALLNLTGLVTNLWRGNWWGAGFSAFGLAVAGVLIALALRTKVDARIERVRANYPAVPTYPTVRAALKAHPLTPPPVPSPDEDENFWTRSAR